MLKSLVNALTITDIVIGIALLAAIILALFLFARMSYKCIFMEEYEEDEDDFDEIFGEDDSMEN